MKFADNISITGANELDLVNLKDINHEVLTVNKDTGLYEFHTGLTNDLSVDFGTEAYNETATNADGVVAFNVNENFIDEVYDVFEQNKRNNSESRKYSKLHTKKFAVSNLSEYGYCVF